MPTNEAVHSLVYSVDCAESLTGWMTWEAQIDGFVNSVQWLNVHHSPWVTLRPYAGGIIPIKKSLHKMLVSETFNCLAPLFTYC